MTADLFSLTPPAVLPAATLAALQEIRVEEKRLWIEKILNAYVAKGGNLDDLSRSLRWERVDHDLVARLVDTLRDRGAAS